MQEVSQAYASGADDNIRNVDVKIKDLSSNVMFTSSDILSISIQKSITDGGLAIGCAQSDRINLQVFSNRKMPRRTWFMVSVAFGESEKRIGIFDSDECTRDGSVINVTAYDAMYYQSKKTVQFTGSASMNLAPLTFPCLMQDVLDYLCTLRNFRTEFVCQPFTVSKLPVKDDGSFYTVRELLGFIAACHGCNVKVDMNNYLQFKAFEEVNYTADSSDVVDLTIDDSDPYEVTGVLFTVDNETTIYIDDVPGSEYDEDDVGVISCFNPFATVEIAEYVWSQIGGLSYYGGSLTQRGKGIIEVGDVITTGNLKYPNDPTSYRFCVTSINYSLTADGGFVETLGSNVEKDGSAMSSNSNDLSPGGGSGTGKWLDDAHTSVAHNDWDNNTSQGKYDSVDGYDNVLTGTSTISQSGYVSNGSNTVTGQHNRVNNSSAVNVSGRRNTVNGSDSSVITGVDNTITNNAYCSFIGGKSVITGSNGTRYSVVLGDEITISNYADNSFVNGSDETFLSSVFQSIIVGDVNGGYSSGNYLPAGEIGCSIVVSDSAIISQLYCSIISGLNNKAYSRVSNSLITGAGNTGIGVYAGIICGSENTVGNGGNSPSSDIIGGSNNIVQSDNCGVVGHGNYVSSPDCIVCGCYGETSGSNAYYFVIGGGLSTSDRSNIFTVAPNGNVRAAGTITPGGADYAEYFEWADGNPEKEDRRGMLVTLDGDKIVPANGDDILGVISGCASVIGNACDLYWHGKYAKDIYGRIITTPGGEPLISPDYDPEQEYIPRTQRPEWSPVGLVGRLTVRDNGKCEIGGRVSARRGIAVKTTERTGIRVLRRIDETHIEVLIK